MTTNPYFEAADALEGVLNDAVRGVRARSDLETTLRGLMMDFNFSGLDRSAVSAARIAVESCIGPRNSNDQLRVMFARTKIGSVRIRGEVHERLTSGIEE